MGVTGLLPAIKSVQEPTTLQRYRGRTLAVDSYSWLHKSLMTCSFELAQGMPTEKYVTYFMRRVTLLEDHGITPYLVFDGDHLPTKAGTERERAARREENRVKAADYARRGNTKEAYKCYMKCADVTPAMVKSVIQVLKHRGLQYVVAPYEADSQMVYLEAQGLVSGIVSEDSDLLVFGCRTLITKLNDRGECIEVSRDRFSACTELPLALFSLAQWRAVAILSGCDYTLGVKGVGVKSAFQLIKQHTTLERVLVALRMNGKPVPREFEDEVLQADLAFQFQRVFCPVKKALTTLNEYQEENPLHECCGAAYEDALLHERIARGDVCPFSKEELHPRDVVLAGRPSASADVAGTGRVTPAARSLSTPLPKLANSIDLFFRLSKHTLKGPTPPSLGTSTSLGSSSLNPGKPRSSTLPRTLTFPAVSRPVQSSKRPFETKSTGLASNFFKKRAMVVPDTEGYEDEIVSSPENGGLAAKYGMDSSDFDLTDPEDESPLLEPLPQVSAAPSPIPAKHISHIPGFETDDISECESDIDEIFLHTSTASLEDRLTNNLLAIAQGLKLKFSFSSVNTPESSPMESKVVERILPVIRKKISSANARKLTAPSPRLIMSSPLSLSGSQGPVSSPNSRARLDLFRFTRA
ncbi:hypothetical protein BABINDRAFT_161127 [Babjeviella inositovora NRRL Y-12698]|uniref:Uncharacterized protein n=1 Tax=Babjeviella inositovora NRRL Y-12698 TaxID=984486 RepID=A0A1E3QR87_9ASCO|nr:uncharacterized protein BABINDRAFT_161127 [Babjeviella inositovora NRRL Y-12698]ODQ80148.1 hypothetical protein BABINDRAFT_161127 [Babjeviella inositovora NRRL Y-12698]